MEAAATPDGYQANTDLLYINFEDGCLCKRYSWRGKHNLNFQKKCGNSNLNICSLIETSGLFFVHRYAKGILVSGV
jgi:hypothetical protein